MWPLVLTASLISSISATAGPGVLSGHARLEIRDGGLAITHEQAGEAFLQALPVSLEIVAKSQASASTPGIWQEKAYDEARALGDGLVASAHCVSPGGSRFLVRDEWFAYDARGRFRLRRTAEVLEASEADAGFASRFSLRHAVPPPADKLEYFMPGMWYYKNEYNATERGLTAGSGRRQIMIRDDRMSLPVFTVRNEVNGLTLTLFHKDPATAPVREDVGKARVIHPGLSFGALGLCETTPPRIAFAFPGTEGDRTQVSGPGGGWAFRNHPVRKGFTQRWEIVIAVGTTKDYGEAVRNAWRLAWDDFHPPVEMVDQRKVYETGIDIFKKYWKSFDGAAGVPFLIYVADGVNKEGKPVKSGQAGDYSFQMGFVGQQTYVGYHLLRYGLERGDGEAAMKGESIIDWWARASMTESGLPRQWYGARLGKFRDNFDPFLRLGCEGVRGVLQAWDVARKHGLDRPAWKQYARRFAGWLAAHQNADGSWYRRYRYDGSISTLDEKGSSSAKNNTSHALPFLYDCWLVFGDETYRQALLKAGEFCLREIHDKYQYRGGATDTANLQDKEGGMKAFEGFLALYDLTEDPRFLAAARQAADYSETYTFAWRLPLPEGGLPQATIPLDKRSGLGLSILTTVPGAADNGIGYLAFPYYRLYLITQDRHYLEFARFIYHGAKQTSDWDGALGYAHPALQTEAGRMGGDMGMRGRSVNAWLPWVTICNLNPMGEFMDAFGTFELEEIERRPLDERLMMERQYAGNRGFDRSAPVAP